MLHLSSKKVNMISQIRICFGSYHNLVPNFCTGHLMPLTSISGRFSYAHSTKRRRKFAIYQS